MRMLCAFGLLLLVACRDSGPVMLHQRPEAAVHLQLHQGDRLWLEGELVFSRRHDNLQFVYPDQPGATPRARTLVAAADGLTVFEDGKPRPAKPDENEHFRVIRALVDAAARVTESGSPYVVEVQGKAFRVTLRERDEMHGKR